MEGVREVHNGATLLGSQDLGGANTAFFGYSPTDGDTATSVRFRLNLLIVGTSGAFTTFYFGRVISYNFNRYGRSGTLPDLGFTKRTNANRVPFVADTFFFCRLSRPFDSSQPAPSAHCAMGYSEQASKNKQTERTRFGHQPDDSQIVEDDRYSRRVIKIPLETNIRRQTRYLRYGKVSMP